MIKTFKHRGLKKLYELGDGKRIRADLLERVETILNRLDNSKAIEDMRVHSYRLHRLKGNLNGFWAVTVRSNWRIIFRFEEGHAYDVDFLDYHGA